MATIEQLKQRLAKAEAKLVKEKKIEDLKTNIRGVRSSRIKLRAAKFKRVASGISKGLKSISKAARKVQRVKPVKIRKKRKVGKRRKPRQVVLRF